MIVESWDLGRCCFPLLSAHSTTLHTWCARECVECLLPTRRTSLSWNHFIPVTTHHFASPLGKSYVVNPHPSPKRNEKKKSHSFESQRGNRPHSLIENQRQNKKKKIFRRYQPSLKFHIYFFYSFQFLFKTVSISFSTPHTLSLSSLTHFPSYPPTSYFPHEVASLPSSSFLFFILRTFRLKNTYSQNRS